MSEVAGKIATQAGAFFLEKPLGGRGILLGGVPGVAPATVMVIGGGAVGMNAAFIAIGMEADVFVYDVSHRQAARARRRLRRPRLDRLLVDSRDRGDAPARRPGDRGGPRPRRQGAVRRAPRPAQADEAQRGAGGRRDRPGRLLRDLTPDHAPRSGLRGRRDHPLLRRQHARRCADHVDLRTDQRHAAVCPGPGRPRRGRGRPARPRPQARDQRRRRATSLIRPSPKPSASNTRRSRTCSAASRKSDTSGARRRCATSRRGSTSC